jgi:hypothetical protein
MVRHQIIPQAQQLSVLSHLVNINVIYGKRAEPSTRTDCFKESQKREMKNANKKKQQKLGVVVEEQSKIE